MLQTKVVEEIKVHILCSYFFVVENHAVYEIMWKNTVERGRPQMAIWRMRIACWITMDTNTHSEYVTHCFPTVTMVARTLLNITLYVQRLSCAEFEFSLQSRSCQLYLGKMILCLRKACT